MAILGVAIAVFFFLGGIYAIARPQYALLFILLLFPVKQLLQMSVPYFQSDTGGTYINIAAGIIVLIAATILVLRQPQSIRGMWNGVSLVILLIYLQIVLGLLYTPARPAALFLLNQWWPYAILLLVLQPLLISRLADLRAITPALLVLGCIIAVLVMSFGTIQGGRLVLTIGRMYTGEAVKGNPLATAELGGMIVICGAFYRPAGASLFNTALRITAIALGLALAFLSGSRGQLIFAVLVFAMFIPVAFKLRSVGNFVGGLVGLACFAMLVLVVFQLYSDTESATRWTAKNLSSGTGGRAEAVWALLQAYGKNPAFWLTGLGPGSYNAVVDPGSSGYTYAHNVLAEALGENGVIGLVLLLASIALTFIWGRKLLRLYADDPVMRGSVAILGGMTAFTLLLAFKQSSLLGTPTYFAWMIMLAKVAKSELAMAVVDDGYSEYGYEQEPYQADEHGEPLPAG